jgi:hypothetical protein
MALVAFWLALHAILWPKDPAQHAQRKTSALVIDLCFSPVALFLVFFPTLILLLFFGMVLS